MTTVIDKMPDTARVWIYQADRKLSDSEIDHVRNKAESFVDQWAAHGKDLAASFIIEKDQFLIFMVDESYNQASGCSIDSSVALVRELGNDLSVSFLDRSKIAFLQDGQVILYPFNKIKEVISNGEITHETPVFNNAVENVYEFKTNWLIPSGKSWLSRYFN